MNEFACVLIVGTVAIVAPRVRQVVEKITA